MVPRPWDFKLVPNILLVCGSVLAQLYTQDGRSWKLSALLLAVVLSQIVYEGILTEMPVTPMFGTRHLWDVPPISSPLFVTF